jgi:hypothetical protein
MDIINIRLTRSNLQAICAELVEVATGEEERAKLIECSQNLVPKMREFIIELRNQAIEQAAWDWSVLLSLVTQPSPTNLWQTMKSVIHQKQVSAVKI